MMKNYLFLVLLGFSYAGYAQRFMPVSEMIANYKEKKDVNRLKECDIIYNFEESSETGLFMETSLLPPDLPRPKGICIEWCFEYLRGYERMLYLKKIYSAQKNRSKEALQYESELAEKYGKDDRGIRAVWYSGKLTTLSCPRNLFGEIVTKGVTEFRIDKGKVVSQKYLKVAKTGAMEDFRKSRSVNEHAVSGTLDGCWHSNMQYKLDMLDEFVNSTLKKQAMPTARFKVEILLVTDKQGKATGYLLSSKEVLNGEERSVTEQLMKRIGELPRWSFGWLWTIEGKILQGRYLKGEYMSETGWRFKDYLH